MQYTAMWFKDYKDLNLSNNQVSGQLIIEDKKICLELNGTFEEENIFGNCRDYDILYGFAKDGKLIILKKCSLTKNTMNIPGYETSNYKCETAFVFKNIDSYENLNIDSIYFEFNALNNYFVNNTFRFTSNKDTKSFLFNCDYFEDQIMRFCIQERRYQIERTWETNKNNKDDNLFTCLSKIIFKLQTSNLLGVNFMEFYYNIFINDIYEIRELFGLLTNRYIEIKNIIFKQNKSPVCEIFDIRNRYVIDDSIDIREQIHLTNKDIELLLSNYFQKSQKYKNILGLINEHIFEYKQEHIIRVKSSFINLCGILEDYYRNIYSYKPAEDNSFLVMQQEIMEKLNQEENRWLNNRLKYSNEISFRKIIEKFFGDFNAISNSFIATKLNKRKTKSLITKIYNTRNWYTHYGNKKNVLSDTLIVTVINLMWIMLRYLILSDFKINSEHLISSIKNDYKLSQLLNKIVEQ